MQICKDRERLVTDILFVLLSALSVIGIWKTVYFGADIDESYALTMAARLASGERLLVDMWEPHQMSAVLYAPMVALYKGITGSMEGALVFMRLFGIIVQGLISLWLYRMLRRDMPGWLSVILAFIYFNFTPKHVQSPEFTLLFYWCMMTLMLSLLGYFSERKYRYLFCAGLSVSCLVLCYPAAVLVFFYVVLWLVAERKKKGYSAIWYFVGTCTVCAILFLVLLVSGGGGFGVFSNIPNVLMDASHDQSLAYLLESHLKGLWDMLRIVLALIVICHVGRPVFCKKKKRDALFFSALLLLMGAYALYQFHGISKVNYTVFLPIILQLACVEWYAYASFAKTEQDCLYFYVSLPLNTVGFVAVLFMSNLPTNYSVSFLMPAVIVGAWQIYRIYREENICMWRICRGAAVLLVICVLTQVLSSRILLVRFTGGSRRNIFETYYQVDDGVLKGIHLGEFDYSQYEIKKALLQKYVKQQDRLLYIGADMFLYSQLEKGQIATGNTISTPAFSGQLMRYYEKNPAKIPTVVFVDREYAADFSVVLEQEPMKSFMEKYFSMDRALTEPAVTVYLRNK